MNLEERIADAVDEVEVWELLSWAAMTPAEHDQADESLQSTRAELAELRRLAVRP